MDPSFRFKDVLPAGILVFLDRGSLRCLSAAGGATAWRTVLPGLTDAMWLLLGSYREWHRASLACPEPRQGWTEAAPRCSSPLCDSDTGLWLPTPGEVHEDSDEHPRFPCGNSLWGSITIRSEIAARPALVACSWNCGRILKHIARIRGRRESVLVASRTRLTPESMEAWRHRVGLANMPIPREYLLLTEMGEFSKVQDENRA